MVMSPPVRVVMVTGLQAAGKSTVAPLLARRLGPPAASFDGDVLYDMMVAGNEPMTADPTGEALRQLELRYRGAALLAQHYVDHGVDFVYSDIVLGRHVTDWLDSVRGAERHLVVLAPTIEQIAARERGRDANSYRDWFTPGGSLEDAIRSLAAGLDNTPRCGLWLDTSDLTPAETVELILADDMRASRFT
jgi:chloramphenicol 3-O-phosphotransferase